MPDSVYRIAHDIAVRAISDQARTLDDLRSRAGTLFAAAAIVTTFLGGAVFDEQAFEPLSTSGVAVASFLATALLTLVIVWPFDLGFSLSAHVHRRGRETYRGAPGNCG